MDVENKKKTNKIIYLIVLFIIIMSLVALGLLYFTNENFKAKADTFLKRLPFMNEEDDPKYSQADLENKVEDIAEYYLSTEEDMTAYKLFTIKTKDEILYTDIVRAMNQKSSSKTEKLIKKVRELQDIDDVLISMHNEATNEKNDKILEEARRLENMELSLAINEIEMKLENDNEFIKNLNEILHNMNEENLSNILYYMDEEKREELYNLLDKDFRPKVERMVYNKNIEYTRLVDLAGLYENKSIEVLLDEIGNTENYTIEELAVIYSNLSTIKAAEVLSKVKDDVFVQDLFTAIRKEQQLRGLESTVANINQAIQFISEYNDKINELVKVYEKMEANKAAIIMEQMIVNNTSVTQLTIESEPIYEITDSMIVVDVLKNMKEKTISNIMNYMRTENATKLTQMLASP